MQMGMVLHLSSPGDAGGAFCISQCALNAFDGHGNGRVRPLLPAPADGREEEFRIAVHEPITAEQGVG